MVRSSMWAPEFNKKHLKKAGGQFGRNVVNITDEDTGPKTLNEKNFNLCLRNSDNKDFFSQ